MRPVPTFAANGRIGRAREVRLGWLWLCALRRDPLADVIHVIYEFLDGRWISTFEILRNYEPELIANFELSVVAQRKQSRWSVVLV